MTKKYVLGGWIFWPIFSLGMYHFLFSAPHLLLLLLDSYSPASFIVWSVWGRLWAVGWGAGRGLDFQPINQKDAPSLTALIDPLTNTKRVNLSDPPLWLSIMSDISQQNIYTITVVLFYFYPPNKLNSTQLTAGQQNIFRWKFLSFFPLTFILQKFKVNVI